MNDNDFWALCAAGNFDEVEALIKSGANVNAKDKHGRTALMLAAVKGHTETIEILLKNGANFEEWRYCAYINFWRWLREGRNNLIELLLKHGISANAHDSAGRTAVNAGITIRS